MNVCSEPSGIEELKTAVAAIVSDDGFSLPSKSARMAVATVTRVLSWFSGHRKLPKVAVFAQELVGSLQGCLTKDSTHKQRENV